MKTDDDQLARAARAAQLRQTIDQLKSGGGDTNQAGPVDPRQVASSPPNFRDLIAKRMQKMAEEKKK